MILLLTGAYKYTDEQLEILKKNGMDIIYVNREDEVLDKKCYEAEIIVCNWLLFHHDIRSFKKLKCIQLLSAGLDRVPLDYIEKKEIKLFNAQGVYSVPMAEFAIGSVLQIYKDSRFFFEQQEKKVWKKRRNLMEIYNKRVLVLGAGSVGSEVAKRFSAFTKYVYGIDILQKKQDGFVEIYPFDDLQTELSKSDIVIVTLPLTNDTRGLFDSKMFEKMKQGAVLVNIARGGIIDENALIDALHQKLMGAALDVFLNEPIPKDSKLWHCENLIISPHNSFVSEGNNLRMWNCICKNIMSFVKRI